LKLHIIYKDDKNICESLLQILKTNRREEDPPKRDGEGSQSHPRTHSQALRVFLNAIPPDFAQTKILLDPELDDESDDWDK